MLSSVLADNRRSAYRVRPIATDHLALALLSADQSHIPDEIADVTCHGASVRFAKDKAPAVTKGDQIKLAIESPNLRGKATLTARIVFTGESTTERLIGLSFDTTEDLTGRGGDNFFQLFNRRMAYRGTDAVSAEDLRAAVKPIESAHNNRTLYPVAVRNLSATGVCLDVAKDADTFMRERVNIRVALRLPGHTRSRDIVTRVCYRSTSEDKIYYGCHFDWPTTPDSEHILEDVTAYTLDRFDSGLQKVTA